MLDLGIFAYLLKPSIYTIKKLYLINQQYKIEFFIENLAKLVIIFRAIYSNKSVRYLYSILSSDWNPWFDTRAQTTNAWSKNCIIFVIIAPSYLKLFE